VSTMTAGWEIATRAFVVEELWRQTTYELLTDRLVFTLRSAEATDTGCGAVSADGWECLWAEPHGEAPHVMADPGHFHAVFGPAWHVFAVVAAVRSRP